MSLSNEYDNYITYLKLLKLVSQNDLKKWKSTIETIFLIRINKLTDEPYSGYRKIDQTEYELIKGFIEYSKLDINLTEQFINIINGIIYTNDKSRITKRDNKLFYKNLSFQLDDRINYLIEKTNKRKVVNMLLRYSGLGISGNQCSVPSNVYKYLYDTFNVRCEGFCSPLNSKLIVYPDTKICTLFKDTDKYFGSLGKFSKEHLIKHQDKNWVLNPPFIPSLIRTIVWQIIETFDEIQNDNFMVILVIPKWKSKTYDYLTTHSLVKHLITPQPMEHYMNCNGKLVKMYGISNNMFFLTKNKELVDVEHINKIKKLWNTKETELNDNSQFIQPTFINT